MRQAYLTAPRTIEWRDSKSPKPGQGEVLANIRAALTCGTDLKTYRRGHPKLQFGPFGHEAAGDIVAVGSGVDRYAPGEAIMWVQTAPCGKCEFCASGSENLCLRLFESVALGAYGDQVLLPANVVARNVYRKPAHLTYVEAAFLEPLSCAVHGWNVLCRANARRPTPENVAIIGAGTIGLLHLLNAVRSKVPVTVIARGAERRALAARLGAKVAVDAKDSAAVEALAGTFSAVIECAGSAETWRLAIQLAHPGGRVLYFSGLPSGAEVALDATRIHYAELTCIGAFHFTPADVREAFELLSFGAIAVRPLVSGIERLDRLGDVFERLDRRDGYKYALVPGAARAEWI